MSSLDLIPIGIGDVTVSNFTQHIPTFVKAFNASGPAGRDLVSGDKKKPTIPTKYHVDADGKNIFVTNPTSSVQELQSDYELIPDKSTTSKSGLSDFELDREQARDLLKEYRNDEKLLMTAILSKMSQPSYATLQTKKGTDGFSSVVEAIDTLALWKLILETHLHGTSSIAKSKSLLSQSGMSHEEYLSKFSALSNVVSSNFQSKTHPGYILADDLFKILYIEGVGPQFQRPKEAIFEFKADGTKEEWQDYVQSYNINSIGSMSVGIDTSALIAPVINRQPSVTHRQNEDQHQCSWRRSLGLPYLGS